MFQLQSSRPHYECMFQGKGGISSRLLSSTNSIIGGGRGPYSTPYVFGRGSSGRGAGHGSGVVAVVASKAIYIHKGQRKMSEFCAIFIRVCETIFEKPRHGLSYTLVSGPSVVTNNIAEVFNGWILEVVDKPILSMLKWTRVYLMDKFAKQKLKAQKFLAKKGKMASKALKQLNLHIKNAKN